MKRLLNSVGVLSAMILIFAGVFFIPTWKGLLGYWRGSTPEFVVENADFRQVRIKLERLGILVIPCDRERLDRSTGLHLKSNQHAYSFSAGKPFSWFRIGTAFDVVYIVTEQKQDGTESIVDSKRRMELEGP